ncbi:hypothetical protein HK101_010923 [Irineochytrium annulatum]|nr:hypothetical protein HK101_010923 [Irineochytrium annulatum]
MSKPNSNHGGDIVPPYEVIAFPDGTGHLLHFPSFFSAESTPGSADAVLADLLTSIAWSTSSITLFGKSIQEPRLTSRITDEPFTYNYTNAEHRATQSFTSAPTVVALKHRIEAALSVVAGGPIRFNYCMANQYRNGKDYVGPHSDAEKELGRECTIASVSLGATRRFVFTRRKSKRKVAWPKSHGEAPLQHVVPARPWGDVVVAERNKEGLGTLEEDLRPLKKGRKLEEDAEKGVIKAEVAERNEERVGTLEEERRPPKRLKLEEDAKKAVIKVDGDRFEMPLKHGALVVMCGDMQIFWKHSVPKDGKCTQPRVNLTYRLLGPQAGKGAVEKVT